MIADGKVDAAQPTWLISKKYSSGTRHSYRPAVASRGDRLALPLVHQEYIRAGRNWSRRMLLVVAVVGGEDDVGSPPATVLFDDFQQRPGRDTLPAVVVNATHWVTQWMSETLSVCGSAMNSSSRRPEATLHRAIHVEAEISVRFTSGLGRRGPAPAQSLTRRWAPAAARSRCGSPMVPVQQTAPRRGPNPACRSISLFADLAGNFYLVLVRHALPLVRVEVKRLTVFAAGCKREATDLSNVWREHATTRPTGPRGASRPWLHSRSAGFNSIGVILPESCDSSSMKHTNLEEYRQQLER